MKQYLRIFLSLFLLSFSISSFAQTPASDDHNFSLQQCIDYALTHQSAYLNAQIDEQISKKKVQEILGLGLPQISGSGSFNDFIDIPTSLIPGEIFGGAPGSYLPVKFGTQFSASGGFEGSQLVFDGQYFVGLQATKALKEFAGKNTERTKIETITTVTKAYYNALIADKRLELLNTNVDRIEKLKGDVKIMFDNGFVEQLDVDRVNVTYNNLKTEQNNITKLVELSKYLLKYQMGLSVYSKLALTDSLHAENFEAMLGNDFDPQNRIEMQLLNSQRTLYSLDIKRNKMGYLPGLYAFGSYSWQAQSNDINVFDASQKWYPTGVVGLKLAVPIFDGLQKARRIQTGNLNLQKNANESINLANALDLQYATAKTQLQNATKSFQSQQENLTLAEKVYNTTKSKYEQGVGLNADMINAQAALKESQTNYLNALYDALIAETDFLSATGQIK